MQNVTLHTAAVGTFIGTIRISTDVNRVVIDIDDDRRAVLLDVTSRNRDQGRFRHRRNGWRICDNLPHAIMEALSLAQVECASIHCTRYEIYNMLIMWCVFSLAIDT